MRMAIPLVMLSLIGWTSLAQTAPPRQGGTRVSGLEAMRILNNQRQYAKGVDIGYKLLWDDIRQPEVLFLLGTALEGVKKTEEAAGVYAVFLRTLDANAPAAMVRSKPIVERRLKNLKRDRETLLAEYAKTAKGKRFESPEKVEETWIDVIEGDLFNLHGLYAWTLVGPGRKDAKPDWIHNKPGARLHRSGMKYLPEVEGRKGVLFTVPLKEMNARDADASNQAGVKRLGHNPRAVMTNAGACRFLRVGTRAYGFPYELRVIVGGERLATERVGVNEWKDLKFELPNPEPSQMVTLEFIVPAGQKWSEGLWLDYVDYFDN